MAAEKRNSFKLAQTQTRGNVKKAIDGVFRTICFQDMLALVLWWAMLDYEWQNGKTSVVPLIMGNRIGKIKTGQKTPSRGKRKVVFLGILGWKSFCDQLKIEEIEIQVKMNDWCSLWAPKTNIFTSYCFRLSSRLFLRLFSICVPSNEANRKV